jgi:hypothetical protein
MQHFARSRADQNLLRRQILTVGQSGVEFAELLVMVAPPSGSTLIMASMEDCGGPSDFR